MPLNEALNHPNQSEKVLSEAVTVQRYERRIKIEK